jgi:anti-sigma B factor antagonist
MTTRADIAVEQEADVVVAELTGEVDMTNAAYVREELSAVVPNGARALVVGLAGTSYLDSAAIELLFELSRRLARRRQVLRLVVPEDSPLRRLLVLTDVQSVAELYSSLADARASA